MDWKSEPLPEARTAMFPRDFDGTGGDGGDDAGEGVDGDGREFEIGDGGTSVFCS